jgi:O-antigen/teichoic acid export membrane protein
MCGTAAMSGATAAGYLTWAWNLALVPYIAIEIVCRVAFPVCSRLQNDLSMFARTVERNVRMAALGVFPIATIVAAMAPYAVLYIYSPKADPTKWMPAVPALNLFLLSIMASPIVNVYSNAFYALGRPRTSVKLTAVYVFVGWAFNVPLVKYHNFFGIHNSFDGIAWSALLVALLCVWLPMQAMKKVAPVRVARNIWAPLVSSLLAMALTRWVALHTISLSPGAGSRLLPVLMIFVVTLMGCISYVAFLLILERKRLITELSSFWMLIKKPSPVAEAACGDKVEVVD